MGRIPTKPVHKLTLWFRLKYWFQTHPCVGCEWPLKHIWPRVGKVNRICPTCRDRIAAVRTSNMHWCNDCREFHI